ncbi:DNA-binding transcriptional LysR family regulator [Kribbella orskensis]|uniref:DNA-binding transcriptional LysR family regulator n=1 Tax=Kribbella orskensis TaxID=2512216 RepID=A0ABY2B964_9ACTN|nr:MULTISPECIES: LysR family transcriptional regulator [Kribbella]TCN31707.1 DNA-binding transcriptional LysR family regulator [Kribbella sp. VKM Ac-2500]TCO12287.1 DNA-binding transcriptional LysR family regulator [Kribbella orskensis]
MLDLRRLRLLRELDARGTVHGAARALGYTPSAISQQLTVLEREAGAKLLERTGRNVRLTDAGRVLVRHAATLLDGMEAAEAEVAAIAAGHPAGVVRVSAFQSAFLRIVAPAVAALARSHPDIRVEVTEAEVEESVPALRLRQLDAVVGDEYSGQPRPVHSDLIRESLVREQVRVVLPETHPQASQSRVRMAQLADARWAACQPGTGHREMQIRACRELGGFEPDLRYASDDFLILVELVRTAGACALLPDLVVGYGTPGVAVRSFAEGAIDREVFLLTRATRTPAVEAVAAALHQATP